MAHRTDLSSPDRMCTTNSSSSGVVHLAGGNLLSAHLNPAEEEEGGGKDLTDVAAKCPALLVTRIWTQSQSAGTITNYSSIGRYKPTQQIPPIYGGYQKHWNTGALMP